MKKNILLAVSILLAAYFASIFIGGLLDKNYQISVNVHKTGISRIDIQVDTLIKEKTEFIKKSGKTLKEIGSSGKSELVIKSDGYSYDDNIKSIKVTIYEYAGGAHGNTSYETWTYNKQTGRTFMYKDLFQEEHNPSWTIYPMVKEQLMKKISAPDKDWIKKGSGQESTLENYKHFVLDGENLVIIFPPYQVAPFAEGTQEVKIPMKDIKVILRPPFYP